MTILLNKVFASIALGHLYVDILNAQRGILLAYLSVPLGLTNSLLGLVSTIYMVAAALAQPVFGYLSDRLGPRWVVAGGILWMGAFFSLGLLVQGRIALIFLILASIGSGAFHPAGSSQATLLGRTHFTGRETTAGSFFFVFGQLGYFFGPIMGGPLLDIWGPMGLMALAIFFLPVSGFAGYQFSAIVKSIKPEVGSVGEPAPRAILRLQPGVIAILVIAAACQSWIQQNINTFVPKYLSDMGQSASMYGFITALFMGGSALGNVLGGVLADRIGRKQVLFGSMLLGSLPLFLLARVGISGWLYLLIPVAGVFSGAAFTVIVVSSQSLVPGGMGLATGLILGFTFSSGSLGSLFSGFLADAQGFLPVFYLNAGLALLAALAVLALHGEPFRLYPNKKMEPDYRDP
ncbi:MAG: MFS transporter [Chloroflexi bacterium]|nr:MFS transporter [Chloroflexota bacterium]